ncbi:MAG: hypothetical protein V3V02_07985 [Rhizobiaceae bacterium]
MSDTALYLSLAIVLFGIGIMLAFVFTIRRNHRLNKDKYKWKPEQDYDVVLRGETPMTPGMPRLIPRDKSKPDDKTRN